MTSEQLEAARAERMRHNGLGPLTLEDARTWIEETGLCLFLPRRQFSASVAPSFVEAIVGHQDATPDPRHIALAEELLVRLELDGVAVRLNLQGQPGEQPDFVVASWVLPYVYALRGDRDWRRNPQLTGSRAVSPLAVQTYKLLEAGDSTVSHLKQGLGREVSESAVVRAITELWQQLRIIPVISAPGHAAKWQLLRHRFQKAIAEGASTSQVTAISVLASIYLQAVIAASMEEVEMFLSTLTARSKVREVLRGLVATRQVHTISLGHAPHFYVAGTLPEFAPTPALYAGTTFSSSYYMNGREPEERFVEPTVPQPSVFSKPAPTAPIEPPAPVHVESHAPRTPVRKPAAANKPASRPHVSHPAPRGRDRKPAAAGKSAGASNGSRFARRGSETRSTASGTRWAKNGNGHGNGSHKTAENGTRSNGNGNHASRNGKHSTSASTWGKTAPKSAHNGHSKTVKAGAKPTNGSHKASVGRKDSRTVARSSSRKPALTAGAKAGNSKRYGFTARPNKGSKKRG